MKIKSKLVAAMAVMLLPASVYSVELDFDTMSYGVFVGSYAEDGFTYTLQSAGGAPHYGDAGVSKKLNWYDDWNNGNSVMNVLAQSNSDASNFSSFDLVSGSLSDINSLRFGAFEAKPAIDNSIVSAINVPEPTPLALFGLGLAGLGLVLGRIRQV